jgi:hypothetical protein
MADAPSLASGCAVWAEVFDTPNSEDETERFDRLGAARPRARELDAEPALDAPLIPVRSDRPATLSRGPTSPAGGVGRGRAVGEGRAVLGIEDALRADEGEDGRLGVDPSSGYEWMRRHANQIRREVLRR